jgi:hypothetical protein
MSERSNNLNPVFVNGDKFEVPSPVQVSVLVVDGGGTTDGQYELQQRNGENGPVVATYTNMNEMIPTKPGEHFTTRFTGPLPTTQHD